MHIGHTKTKGRPATAETHADSGGSITVILSGELDHDGVVSIESDVQRATATAQHTLVLDADGVTFVDSAGLRLILQSQMSATSRNVGFVLARPSDNVIRLLELTGLDDLIDTRTA